MFIVVDLSCAPGADQAVLENSERTVPYLEMTSDSSDVYPAAYFIYTA
jgi:hypothetical protein